MTKTKIERPLKGLSNSQLLLLRVLNPQKSREINKELTIRKQ